MWNDLGLIDKARMMQLAVRSGITDLRTIEEVYNTYASGGPLGEEDKQKIIERVNSSNAEFVERLKDPHRKYITNPDGSISTHRLGYATEDDTAIVYPEIQNINDTLKTFPTWQQAFDSAVARGDTLHMSVPEAEWFTTNYKDYYPQFDYASGGKIHIKPENRGKFTALKERTGHSASWFKEHGTPAQKKMAVFALNARKWKHEDGGPLVNLLGEGGPTSNTKETKTYYTPTYKKLPKTYKQGVTEVAQEMNIPEGEVPLYYDTGMLRPALGLREYPNDGRKRDNDSPTQELSEFYERQMNNQIYRGKEGRKPNMPYAIPYLDEKEIKVKGVGRVSTNALDSLAKYAGIVGLPLEEALGLAAQETQFGAIPYYNMGQEGIDARALGNTSYFRNYGVIPAENLVRDFRYNTADWKGEYIDQSKPPLQHAFEYYKKGDYNRGDPNHTSDVKKRGKALMTDSNIIKWMQTSPFVKKK